MWSIFLNSSKWLTFFIPTVRLIAAALVLVGCSRQAEFEFDSRLLDDFLSRSGIGLGFMFQEIPPQVVEEDSRLFIALKLYNAQSLSCDAIGIDYTVTPNVILTGTESVIFSGTWPDCELIVVPDADANGEVLIDLIMSDGESRFARSFQLQVLPVNDVPVIAENVNKSFVTETGTTAEIVLPVVSDPDTATNRQRLSYVVLQSPKNGMLGDLPHPNIGGSITYTPNFGFLGVDGFSYAVCDDAAPQISCTQTIEVAVSVTSSSGDSETSIANTPLLVFANASGITATAGSDFYLPPASLDGRGHAITDCTISPSLPAGLQIGRFTCAISGRAFSAMEVTKYTLTAMSSAGSGTATINLSIAPQGTVALSKGLKLTNQLSASDEIDTFAITVGAEGIVWFDVDLPSCGAFCWKLSIVDASGLVLSELSPVSSADSSVRIESLVASKGTYFLRVEAGDTWSSLSYAIEGKALSSNELPEGFAGFVGMAGIGAVRPAYVAQTVDYSNLLKVLNEPLFQDRTGWNSGDFLIKGSTGSAWSFLWNIPDIDTIYLRGQRHSNYNAEWKVDGSVAGGPFNTYSSVEYPFSGLSGSIGSAKITALNSSNGLYVQDIAFWGGGSQIPVSWVLADKPSLSFLDGRVLRGVPSQIAPVKQYENELTILSCVVEPMLPEWAKLNTTTCVLTGTPTELSGPMEFVVRATNAVGTATVPLTLSVVEPNPPTLHFVDTTGVAGSPLTIVPDSFDAKGEVITDCQITPQAPDWLTINTTTCALSGTPTELLEPTLFAIKPTTALGTGSASLLLSVVYPQTPLLKYTGSSGTAGMVGEPMTVSPSSVVSLAGSISGCTVAPALPSGLSIDPTTCVILGTPTVGAPKKAYTIVAENPAGQGTEATVELSVSETSGQKVVLSVTSTPTRKYLSLAAGDFFLLRAGRTSDSFTQTSITQDITYYPFQTVSNPPGRGTVGPTGTNLTLELRDSNGTKVCGISSSAVTGSDYPNIDVGCLISSTDTYELFAVGSTDPTVTTNWTWGGYRYRTTTTTSALKIQVHFDVLLRNGVLNTSAFSATSGQMGVSEANIPLISGAFAARKIMLNAGDEFLLLMGDTNSTSGAAYGGKLYSPTGSYPTDCYVESTFSSGKYDTPRRLKCSITESGEYLLLLQLNASASVSGTARIHYDILSSSGVPNTVAFDAVTGALGTPESNILLSNGLYAARKLTLTSGKTLTITTSNSVAQTYTAWDVKVYDPSGSELVDCAISVSPSTASSVTMQKECNILFSGSHLLLLNSASTNNLQETIDFEYSEI